jgi:hypothetical protein
VQSATSTTRVRTALEDQLVREATAMGSYALASGKHLPKSVAQILQNAQQAAQPNNELELSRAVDVGELSWAHAELTRLVAPAAPRAVLLLADPFGCRGWWSIFGPIRMVRYLLAVALASVLGLLFIGASDQVSLATANIFSLTGLPSILNSLFLLCVASVGAAFSGLFRINLYIAATTYDPKHDASYWVQYGLGVIAGVLLATLIPFSEATGSAITRPVLALLGGFSASVIYRLMDRLSRSIESMVAGNADNTVGSNHDWSVPPNSPVSPTADELMTALNRATILLGEAQSVTADSQVVHETSHKQLKAPIRRSDAPRITTQNAA